MTPTFTKSDYVLAFLSGGVLSLMVLFNGMMARATNALFSSFAAHGTGAIAALVFLALGAGRRLRAGAPRAPRAPFWAYLGGLSGAVTVMLGATTVNSALALSGTLALGLVGQMGFSLAADACGLFGLPKRRPGLRDLAPLALIGAGSVLIIYGGNG